MSIRFFLSGIQNQASKISPSLWTEGHINTQELLGIHIQQWTQESRKKIGQQGKDNEAKKGKEERQGKFQVFQSPVPNMVCLHLASIKFLSFVFLKPVQVRFCYLQQKLKWGNNQILHEVSWLIYYWPTFPIISFPFLCISLKAIKMTLACYRENMWTRTVLTILKEKLPVPRKEKIWEYSK